MKTSIFHLATLMAACYCTGDEKNDLEKQFLAVVVNRGYEAKSESLAVTGQFRGPAEFGLGSVAMASVADMKKRPIGIYVVAIAPGDAFLFPHPIPSHPSLTHKFEPAWLPVAEFNRMVLATGVTLDQQSVADYLRFFLKTTCGMHIIDLAEFNRHPRMSRQARQRAADFDERMVGIRCEDAPDGWRFEMSYFYGGGHLYYSAGLVDEQGVVQLTESRRIARGIDIL